MSCTFEELNCSDIVWIVVIIISISCTFSIVTFNVIYIAFNFHYLHPQDVLMVDNELPTYEEATWNR